MTWKLELVGRNHRIIWLRRDCGWTLSAIGKDAGLSRERVRQILAQYERMRKGKKRLRDTFRSIEAHAGERPS